MGYDVVRGASVAVGIIIAALGAYLLYGGVIMVGRVLYYGCMGMMYSPILICL